MATVCTHGVDIGFTALGYGRVAALGVLKGITELLPISSTAHMRLVPAFLGWQDPGSAFSAAMQLAALSAVISCFWSDVKALATNSLRAIAYRQFQDRYLRFSLSRGLATRLRNAFKRCRVKSNLVWKAMNDGHRRQRG
jgi:undecaprenyl-diphosphatase